MVRMISITDLEDEIRMHEGVIVNINRRPLSNTYTVPSRVRSYIEAYPKTLPDNAYVRQLAKLENFLGETTRTDRYGRAAVPAVTKLRSLVEI